jgi:signal peptidase I
LSSGGQPVASLQHRFVNRAAIAIWSGAIVLFFGTYLLNPFRVPSMDPRLRVFGLTVFRTPAGSMVPTIKPNALFIASAWPYARRSPRAGDIMVFRYPPDPSVFYVKRLIAVEGDLVSISRCVAVVNGKKLHEPYVARVEHPDSGICNAEGYIVPKGQLYVLGDARENGADSRLWGLVPRDNVLAKVVGY